MVTSHFISCLVMVIHKRRVQRRFSDVAQVKGSFASSKVRSLEQCSYLERFGAVRIGVAWFRKRESTTVDRSSVEFS